MTIYIMLITIVTWTPTGGTMVFNTVTPHKSMSKCIKNIDKMNKLLKVTYKNVGAKCVTKVMPINL